MFIILKADGSEIQSTICHGFHSARSDLDSRGKSEAPLQIPPDKRLYRNVRKNNEFKAHKTFDGYLSLLLRLIDAPRAERERERES